MTSQSKYCDFCWLNCFTNHFIHDDWSKKGLLGNDKINIVGYCLCVSNIGLPIQAPHGIVSASFWQNNEKLKQFSNRLFAFLMKYEFYYVNKSKNKFIHYLSYVYIRGKSIQLMLLTAVICIHMIFDDLLKYDYRCLGDICTSYDTRTTMVTQRGGYIGIILVCIIVVSLLLYNTLFRFVLTKYMKLAFVLSRQPWTLIQNGKFFDGFRALRSAQGIKPFESLDMPQVLKYIIEKNVLLPHISYTKHEYRLTSRFDLALTTEKMNHTADIEDIRSIINEINSFNKNKVSDCAPLHFLYPLLFDAIEANAVGFVSFFLNSKIYSKIDDFNPLSIELDNTDLRDTYPNTIINKHQTPGGESESIETPGGGNESIDVLANAHRHLNPQLLTLTKQIR